MSSFAIQSEERKQDREQQREQNLIIRNELTDIKSELGKVSEKCKEINDRCTQVEAEQQKLSNAVQSVNADLDQLYDNMAEGRRDSEHLTSTTTALQQQVTAMTEEIDRLESFSRRDNLRFFGIPHTEKEDYESCARSVVDTLNTVESFKTWYVEDIIRAHRVGPTTSGKTRTMIVKFRQWQDKMKLIRDRDYRHELEKNGVRLANDLTRRQAEIVAKAKQDGMAAYFVRGKLTVGPRTPDQRSYAEVAATDTRNDINTVEAGTNGKSSGWHLAVGSDVGDSPLRHRDVRPSSGQSSGAAAPRAEEGGRRAMDGGGGTSQPLGQRDVTASGNQSAELAGVNSAARRLPSSNRVASAREQGDTGRPRDLSPVSSRGSPTGLRHQVAGTVSQCVRGVPSRETPPGVSDSGGYRRAQGRGGTVHGTGRGGGPGRQTTMNTHLTKRGSDRSLRSQSNSK